MKTNEFIEELKKINIELTDYQLNQFETYADFLLEYNKTTNLTAIREKEGVYLKHFLDSILIVKDSIVDFKSINSLIDIGSGAGFPGIVIKIVYPHIKLTVLDSNNKKTKFLEELGKKLNLNDLTVINDRAENYVKENRHKFDISVARAVSELRIISELCLPFTKVDGYFIALKGHCDEELKNAESTLKILNAEVKRKNEFYLPIENSLRTNLYIKLKKEVDNKYPRPYDQIIKKALK